LGGKFSGFYSAITAIAAVGYFLGLANPV